jgi:acyl-CoA thioester hydrolase
MELNFSHTTKLRVRYSETDQMGYSYHGNYAQYFEVARVESLRDLGMNYKEMESNGYMLPVSELTINYLLPALYDDELTIISKITSTQGARLFFEYEILNENNKLICTAKTTLVFVSKSTKKPMIPPKEFMDILSPYEIKDELNNIE